MSSEPRKHSNVSVTHAQVAAAKTTNQVRDEWAGEEFEVSDSEADMRDVLHQDQEGYDTKRFHYFRCHVATNARNATRKRMHDILKPAMVTRENHPLVPEHRFDGKDGIYGDGGTTAIFYVPRDRYLKWRGRNMKQVKSNVAALADRLSGAPLAQQIASREGGIGGFMEPVGGGGGNAASVFDFAQAKNDARYKKT